MEEARSSTRLEKVQRVAALVRDLALIGGVIWLVVWSLPLQSDGAVQLAPGVDTFEALRHEVPPAQPDWQRDAQLKADLDTKQLDECWERIDYGAAKNSQMLACLYQEQKRLQAILDIEAARMREAAQGARASMPFGAATRSWASYRDRWCEFESIRNQAPHPRVTELGCAVGLTREFIVQLRKAG